MYLKTIEKIKLLEWMDVFITSRIDYFQKEIPKIGDGDLRENCKEILNEYERMTGWMRIQRIKLAKRV